MRTAERKRRDAVFTVLFCTACAVVALSIAWVAWRTWGDPPDCRPRLNQTQTTRFSPVRETVTRC